MMEKGGETFKINTEGQDTTSELPTLREAIQRTFHTLVRLSQLREDPDFTKNAEREGQNENRKQRGWAQAVYPLRA